MRAVIKELLIDVITDKARFRFSNSHLDLTIEKIKGLEIEDEFVADIPNGVGEFTYLNSDDGVDLEKLCEAIAYVSGILLTPQEKYKRLIEENNNTDFLTSLIESGIVDFLKNNVVNKRTQKIEPIKWNGENINDLAYLFWKLKEENVISANYPGLTLSEIFLNSENEPIKNTLFNKYFSEFTKTKFPTNAAEIDKLIAILKKGSD